MTEKEHSTNDIKKEIMALKSRITGLEASLDFKEFQSAKHELEGASALANYFNIKAEQKRVLLRLAEIKSQSNPIGKFIGQEGSKILALSCEEIREIILHISRYVVTGRLDDFKGEDE